MPKNPYFVKAQLYRGKVKGYGVYREEGTHERCFHTYLTSHSCSADAALLLANTLRDDLNKGVR